MMHTYVVPGEAN